MIISHILLDQMSDQQFTRIQNNTINNRINIEDNAHCYVVQCRRIVCEQ